jgi:hypothetical protein
MPQPLNCKENAELDVEARCRRRLDVEILRRNVEILGGGPAIFLASGAEAARLVLKLRAGARRAVCPAIGAGRAD